MGGYDYSTDKEENTRFNRGVETTSPKPSQVGGYPASTKGNADRMYRMTGNRPTSVSQPTYSAKQNADDLFRKQSSARGGK